VEDLLARSGTEWTAVRPPRLVNREVTGRYRTAIGENLPHAGTISRADVVAACSGARPSRISGLMTNPSPRWGAGGCYAGTQDAP
jgi:hypothetical protein